MRKFGFAALLSVAVAGGVGCSQDTVDKAGEAAGSAGEAIESATQDAAENIEQAAGEVKESVTTDEERVAEPVEDSDEEVTDAPSEE